MRLFLYIFLSGSAFIAIDANPNNKIETNFKIAVEEKCLQNSGSETALLKLMDSSSVFLDCKRNSFKTEPPHPLEDHKGFCNYLRNSDYYSCIENLGEAVLPCLNESEKYIPNLVLHGVNTTFDEICGADGVANSELLFNFFSEDKNPCQMNLYAVVSELECLYNLTMVKNIANRILNLNKRDVCLDLEELQQCSRQVLTRYCEGDYSTLLNLVFKPLVQECGDIKLLDQ